MDYFSKGIINMILDVPVSRTTGFQSLDTKIWEMKNSGLKLSLNATVLQLTDFPGVLGLTPPPQKQDNQTEDDFLTMAPRGARRTGLPILLPL